MKKLLLLCVILIAQNGFGEMSNPYQRPSLERSCYDFLQIVKKSLDYNKIIRKDFEKLQSFELLPSEFLQKYENNTGEESSYAEKRIFAELRPKCDKLDWFKEEVEKL